MASTGAVRNISNSNYLTFKVACRSNLNNTAGVVAEGGSMNGVPWLDEREMAAWRAFLEAGHRVEQRVERQLREDAGLSHQQYEILVRLSEAGPEGLRMTELAQSLITSKSGLTYQIGQLEKRGLVRRESCATDVRGVTARLTGTGREQLRQAAPGHVSAVRAALLDALEPAELELIARALGTVGRRLRPGTAQSAE
jgi:DNA-binding MarR family transcriptional regulator